MAIIGTVAQAHPVRDLDKELRRDLIYPLRSAGTHPQHAVVGDSHETSGHELMAPTARFSGKQEQ